METLPLLGFAIAMSITPGPNVLMVAAAAANHGVRATLPHQGGIALGFAAMLVIVGLGLAGPFAAWPLLHAALKWGGAAWLLVLAWKIARAGAPGEGPSRPPLGFLGAALFQWVNPKAWMIALAAIPAFTTPQGDILAETLLIAGAFALVCLPCTLVWAGLGAGAARLLRNGNSLQAFNIAMALLLVASLIPALM
ncbi:LysE family translocator [Roseomonas alkaliterrae]|uniref:Threonine/homoserine/homoserine lactone efflux protein n=1 Tax=Neoroseomonas alkaliterrae TaxID=1452450 RepID=A0A840XST6_9PROT|nr:LysE family translocator [Neoroseomonas alkaliterrae]MBB5689729.1 threonine/homoserine/homoserine lactone efflux protein [Neoroseomonas alkaliterrae]MBR0677408.1 LysE family translocator [Neoroseomonas alkaliterrae]